MACLTAPPPGAVNVTRATTSPRARVGADGNPPPAARPHREEQPPLQRTLPCAPTTPFVASSLYSPLPGSFARNSTINPAIRNGGTASTPHRGPRAVANPAY